MNLAKPNEFQKNPAKHFMDWIGDRSKEGGFKFWDKEEKKEFVIDGDNLFKNFRFAVLNDDMMGIGGYYKPGECGMFSNEIVGMQCGKVPLKVRVFDKKPFTVIAEGLYADIINDCKAVGGKYLKSIYMMTDFFTGGKEMEIHNIKAMGCCQSQWRNLVDEIKKGIIGELSEKWVRIVEIEKIRQGTTKNYNQPVFKLCEPIEEAEKEKAVELAMVMWDYLEQYLKGGATEEGEEPVDEEESAPPVNTDDWEKYVIPGTNIAALGDLPELTLLTMKKELESTQVFDASYDNICAGIKWHQDFRKHATGKEAKLIQDRATQEAKITDTPKFNPFAAAPKEEPKPINWRETVIEETGRKLGEFDKESLTAMVNHISSEEGKEYEKYLSAISAGLEELAAF